MMQSHLNMRRTARCLLGMSALATGIVLPTSAGAQTTTHIGPQAQAAAANRQADDNDRIAEIVVTAEKRAEGVQNIPIAITAVTGETLEKAGVQDVSGLTQLAPSLQFGTRSTNVFIAMRGIGQAGQDIGSQSGVTVSLDGVPLLNHFLMNPSFNDIGRVEVLRGPQGTIAGRNATGGAINIYSAEPTDTTEGNVIFTLGNYRRMGVKGFVNAALSDQLDGRLSFQTERSDGWLKNGYLKTGLDNTNLAQIRGQLLFHPSPSFRVRGLLEYTRDSGYPQFNQLLGRADPNTPTTVELPGYPFPQNDIENLTVYENDRNRREVRDVRAALIASVDLGSNATLTSTTGYIHHDIDLIDIDVDLTPRPISKFPLIGLYAKQYTQEFTLTADLGSRADLVAGLFYMHGDSEEPLYLDFGTLKNYLIYLPKEKLDSYAGYAQFRYRITDKLRATIGGRYTRDTKSYTMDATVLTFNALLADKNHWTAFTPRFVLDYAPTDDSLIYASVSRGFKSGGFNTLGDITLPVNTFNPEYVWNYEIGAKAAMFDRRLRFGLTGFYSDYTNLQQTVFVINPQTNVRFPRVENSAGAKIKGIEFEFDAAPARGLRFSGAVTRLFAKYGFFCNADPLYPALPTSAECVGVEVNGQPLPAGSQNLEGNYLTQAPEWQANMSGQYTVPVSDSLDLTARADYKWQSRVYFDIYNHPLNSEGSYGLFNASLGLGGADKSWTVTAWVRNAFDKRYIQQAAIAPGVNPSVNGSIGQPRMYGTTLDFRF